MEMLAIATTYATEQNDMTAIQQMQCIEDGVIQILFEEQQLEQAQMQHIVQV